MILCAIPAYAQNPSGGYGPIPSSAGLSGVGAPTGSCVAGTLYTNTTNGNLYSCSAGSWTIVTTAGGGVTSAAGACPIVSSTNAITGSAVCLDMAGIAGADLGLKMANCSTALPATGGTCSGVNLPAAQTLSTAVTTAKPVTFTFAGQQISQSANVNLLNNYSGISCAHNGNTIFTKAGNIDQFTLSGANNFLEGCQLQGVSGSFTGSGIVVGSGATQSDVEFNVVQFEAANQIKSSSNSTLIFDNNVLSSSASAAISGTGTISHNFVQVSQGDGIDANGNLVNIFANSINMAITPAKSGMCGINAIGDQIGDRIGPDNQITISDNNAGDTDYGECDSPTGTHNLNMLFEGDHVQGTIVAGVTEYGLFINNAANLNTNWQVTVQNLGCVHMAGVTPACVKRTDTQNNITTFINIQDTEAANFLDAGTGSTQDVWIWDMYPIPYASIPSPLGNGSHGPCTNCTAGKAITGGNGPGNYVTKVNGALQGLPLATWVNVQSNSGTASAATKTQAFTNNVVPGDVIVVGVACFTVAGVAPTISVADTPNGTYKPFGSVQGNTANTTWWGQMFYMPAAVGGPTSPVMSSSGNACTYTEVTVAEYSNILPTSPLDGAGASAGGNSTAPASGNYTVSLGDLNVGFAFSTGGGLCTGAGSGWTPRSCPGSGDSLLEDQTAATTTANATFTSLTSGWGAIGLAFKRAQ